LLQQGLAPLFGRPFGHQDQPTEYGAASVAGGRVLVARATPAPTRWVDSVEQEAGRQTKARNTSGRTDEQSFAPGHGRQSARADGEEQVLPVGPRGRAGSP